ncbi:MAG: DUF6809 family protein [Neglectibacter sp.]
MSFLEQLFFGNVDPQCRESLHPKAMRKAQRLSAPGADSDGSAPTPQRELFVQYTDAWGTLNALSDLDCFVCGFRLGAQMALDAFKND